MKNALLLLSAILLVSQLPAQTPSLLADALPGRLDGSMVPVGRHGNGQYLFTSVTGAVEIAPNVYSFKSSTFITNGTPAGTARLVDGGAAGRYTAVPFGTKTAFAMGGLYVTDGTPGGTVRLTDSPGVSVTGFLHVVGSRIFFEGNDAAHGSELWVSDGTYAGTRMVKDIWPGQGPGSMYGYTEGSRLKALPTISLDEQNIIFLANDQTHGTQFWISDGTEAGTQPLTNIAPAQGGLTPSGPPANAEQLPFYYVRNRRLYFVANDLEKDTTALWSTDGTAAGTGIVKVLGYQSSMTPNLAPAIDQDLNLFAGLGDKFVFTAPELWVSDGTEAGTVFLKDIAAGYKNGYSDAFTPLNGRLLFSAIDAADRYGVWSTDGTPAGTVQLKQLNVPGSGNGGSETKPAEFTVIGNKAYFHATDFGTSTALWQTDGTAAGTTMLSGSYRKPAGLSAVRNRLFFTAADSQRGLALFQYRPDNGSTSLMLAAGTNLAFHHIEYYAVPMTDSTLIFPGRYDSAVGVEPYVLRVPGAGAAGFGEVAAPSFRAWPNPASTTLSLALPSGPAQVELLDASGRLLRSEAQTAAVQQHDIGALCSGAYLLRVRFPDGHSELMKLTVVR